MEAGKNGGFVDISCITTDKALQVEVEFNDQVKVVIRHVSRDRIAEMIKEVTTIKFDRKTHQKQEDFDALKFAELIGVEAIVGWSGLESEGAPLPCTDENKKLLMRKWTDFAKFVSDTCTDLEGLIEAEEEAVRKNSQNTPGLIS